MTCGECRWFYASQGDARYGTCLDRRDEATATGRVYRRVNETRDCCEPRADEAKEETT